jgi:tRNA-2-methylthio-N6-dimethylallyladenosine synthase
MNENDSEKILGISKEMGFVEYDSNTDPEKKPDLIVLNTCCVRENAEQKLVGYLGIYKKVKEQNPECLLAVCGCMMQQESAVAEIKKKYKFVDIIFGTHNIHEFPMLVGQAYAIRTGNQSSGQGANAGSEVSGKTGKKRGARAADGVGQGCKQYLIRDDSSFITEGLPISRKGPPSALVSIMYGCDNFCSYCIVPYVRGRERSREPGDIINEVEKLAADGYKEVTLLGQNVNSYGKKLAGFDIDFPDLLYKVSRIDGIKRIRFMTSHPKDLTDKLIFAIRDIGPVCGHVHLPVQSGSSDIIKKMNRRYTKEEYIRLTEKIRAEIPDVTITSDIIVGFPGETDEDFRETLDLVNTVRFDMAFTFIYSKRTGTPAAELDGQLDMDTVKSRFNSLVELQNGISHEKNISYIGREVEVLCEGASKQNRFKLTGRTGGAKLVHFNGGKNCIGEILTVRIESAKSFCLEVVII